MRKLAILCTKKSNIYKINKYCSHKRDILIIFKINNEKKNRTHHYYIIIYKMHITKKHEGKHKQQNSLTCVHILC